MITLYNAESNENYNAKSGAIMHFFCIQLSTLFILQNTHRNPYDDPKSAKPFSKLSSSDILWAYSYTHAETALKNNSDD